MGLTVVAAIFVFGLLVLVHEFGHFITAKLTGMRVDEFAIGFGPKLISKQKGETLYSIRIIPLGGFNRIAGMDLDDEENDAGDRAYYKRPVWARMIVILAGSCMNFILPLFLFFGIFFFSGVATPSPEPVVGAVVAERPAAMAGLQAGDRLVSIEGKPVDKWEDISTLLQGAAGKPFKLEYRRGEELRHTTLIPVEEPESKRTIIGITGTVDLRQPGLFEAMELSVQKTGFILVSMVGALLQLIQGQGTAELSGPLGVAQMAGQVAQMGIVPLLNFAALLSLNLGLINLLPVPALDGGHFVTLLLEALRGKPLGKQAMYYIQSFGVVILISLMLFATFNDITK